jgi:hypothetical protein
MIEGKTSSGFEFTVDERILEDWSLVEAISMADSDDESEQIRGLMNLVKIVLGDQFDALKKHIADRNDGYVPSPEVSATIVEIIKTSRAIKNSQSSEG